MDNAEITFSENTRSESTWLKSSFSPVFLGSCLISALLVFASLLLPSLTSSFLSRAGDFYLAKFPYWIIWSVALIFIFSIAFAVIPTIGSRKLGLSDESTQYSFFSWFSMIFGTGMGIGLLTWGIAEPIAGLQNNPDVIRALSTAGTSDNTSSALKWSYAHWGFAGWASYAIVGLAVGYTGHRQRSIIATVFGIVQVLGYALNESVMAFALTNDAHWLLDEKGNATALSKLAASTFIFILAAASAVSGISRGIKWLSNTNMILSLIFLATILLAMYGEKTAQKLAMVYRPGRVRGRCITGRAGGFHSPLLLEFS